MLEMRLYLASWLSAVKNVGAVLQEIKLVYFSRH